MVSKVLVVSCSSNPFASRMVYNPKKFGHSEYVNRIQGALGVYFIVNASPSKPFDVQVVTPDFFDVATAW